MNKIYLIAGVIVIAVAGFFYLSQSPQPNQESSRPVDNTGLKLDTQNSQKAELENQVENKAVTKKMDKPELTIDQSKNYTATLSTTEGDIVIELDAKNTPITANNFVYLAENNFYDNTIFHRIIRDFMIQGGDPEGTGRGGPGYKFDDEEGGLRPEYTRGTVAMANSGKNTNGSQFFIMHQDVPLDPYYVIFGRVIEGIDVVDKIATAEATFGGEQTPSKPVSPVTVKTVTITSE